MSPGDDLALGGSERSPKQGAQRVDDVSPNERLVLTVTLAGPALPEPAAGTPPLTREQLARDYGPGDETIATVTRVLEGVGLKVEEASPLTRSLRVSGTVAAIERVFSPGLGVYHTAEQGRFRAREGELRIPAELDGLVTGVFGLDQRRVARRRFSAPSRSGPQAAGPASAPLTQPVAPAQLARHYNFPEHSAGGQTVAIAEFGGGYFKNDLEQFCAKQGTPVPSVKPVSVNGVPIYTEAEIERLPAQQRATQLEESIEVNMDVQIVAGLAPAADQLVYFSSFDEQGWVELINQVVAGKPAPATTLSVSWGLAEDDPDWSAGAVKAIDERLQAAAALGITVCVAAGDDGSADQESDGRAHIDFPASSPHVLAVGGTMLDGSAEVVWWESPGERTQSGGGATGGGVSTIFARPSWQDVTIASINPGAIDGRVVPDVAALAGPPLYDMIFMGKDSPNGGTSAATPTWASLIALIAAASDPSWKPSFLAPLLYAKTQSGEPIGAAGCTDITSGDNDSSTLGKGYAAAPGFDAASGWGVPNGIALMTALAGSAA